MASALVRDLVGLTAFSRDGTKLGKVKDVLDGCEGGDYLVIGRMLSHSLVVPAGVVEMPGDRVVVPFNSPFLDMAPSIKAKGTLSAQDCEHLKRYFQLHSGETAA